MDRRRQSKGFEICVVLTSLTIPPPVSQQLTSRSFSGSDLQHYLHHDSSCQHEQFILRRLVHFAGSRSTSLTSRTTDWVYVHMDLNPKVGTVVLTLPEQLIQHESIDPLHRLLLAMASRIRQGLRIRPSGEVRVQRHSTVLGLDTWYDLDMLPLRRWTNQSSDRCIGLREQHLLGS